MCTAGHKMLQMCSNMWSRGHYWGTIWSQSALQWHNLCHDCKCCAIMEICHLHRTPQQSHYSSGSVCAPRSLGLASRLEHDTAVSAWAWMSVQWVMNLSEPPRSLHLLYMDHRVTAQALETIHLSEQSPGSSGSGRLCRRKTVYLEVVYLDRLAMNAVCLFRGEAGSVWSEAIGE